MKQKEGSNKKHKRNGHEITGTPSCCSNLIREQKIFTDTMLKSRIKTFFPRIALSPLETKNSS